MQKEQVRISSPDELNKHLQHTSPATWIVLFLISVILVSFFVWSFVYKMTIKLTGKADVISNEVTLRLGTNDLDKLQVGQKVIIENKEGEILSINDNKPTVSSFDLNDGEYVYTIVLKQMRPIDFLLGK